MPKLMIGGANVLKRAEAYLKQINGFVLIVMMFAMFILVFSNVVARYVFDQSISWAEEVARYLMIWTTYLGAGLAMTEGSLVSVDVLHTALPRRAVPYARALIGLIVLAFMGYLMVLGFDYAQFAQGQRTPVLRMSVGLVYLAIPLGALAFVLHMVITFREYVAKPAVEDDAIDSPSGNSTGGGVSEWQ